MAYALFGHRRNPQPVLLGENLEDVAFATGGLTLTAITNDRIVAPVIDKLAPALKQNQLLRKLVDGGTTLGVAAGLGWLIDKADGHVGRLVQFGGSILGVARIVTGFVPQYQLSATTPADAVVGQEAANLLNLGAGRTQNPQALGIADSGTVAALGGYSTTAMLPAGSAAVLPSPAFQYQPAAAAYARKGGL